MQLKDAFRMHRGRGDRVLEAVCSLLAHVFGWELVLTVNGLLSPAPKSVARETRSLALAKSGARR